MTTFSLPLAYSITGILEAVMRAGSQTKLADALGVSQQSVGQWVAKGYVPLSRALQIEKVYGISVHRLINAAHLTTD